MTTALMPWEGVCSVLSHRTVARRAKPSSFNKYGWSTDDESDTVGGNTLR